MWVNRLREEIDRLFEPLTSLVPVAPSSTAAFPPVNLWEDDNNLDLEAELPGFRREDLDIVVRERELTLTGSRPAPETASCAWHLCERAHGKFRRTLTLPTLVDADRVEARYENGVLLLTLPKPERLRARRIRVQGFNDEPPAPLGNEPNGHSQS
jgi:HSP20 family protein